MAPKLGWQRANVRCCAFAVNWAFSTELFEEGESLVFSNKVLQDVNPLDSLKGVDILLLVAREKKVGKDIPKTGKTRAL